MAAQPASVAVPNIEELFQPTHDERARQSMVSMLRKHAIIDLRAELKRDYEGRVEPALRARGAAPISCAQLVDGAAKIGHFHRGLGTIAAFLRDACGGLFIVFCG